MVESAIRKFHGNANLWLARKIIKLFRWDISKGYVFIKLIASKILVLITLSMALNNLFEICLTHFMTMSSFYASQKHQWTSGFLMFWAVIERDQLHKKVKFDYADHMFFELLNLNVKVSFNIAFICDGWVK